MKLINLSQLGYHDIHCDNRDDVTPDGQDLQDDHDNRYNLQKSGLR